MMTANMIDWNNFYHDRDEWICNERKHLMLAIGASRHAANVIWKREQNGGDLSVWEFVARDIISDAAKYPYLILDEECTAVAYLIEWYCRRTNHIEKLWIELLDFVER